MTIPHKDDTYLGDSVYLSKEENDIILYTYNGMGRPSNVIHIEPEVYRALLKSMPNSMSILQS